MSRRQSHRSCFLHRRRRRLGPSDLLVWRSSDLDVKHEAPAFVPYEVTLPDLVRLMLHGIAAGTQ